jgi:nucleotide-binding universal stress UspA family protein
MFKTICLALDGSENSKKAIPVAAELAEKENAKIVIAHVVEMVAGKGGVVPIHEEDEILDVLKAEAEALKKRGIDTEIEIAENVVGGPARRIIEIADRNNADMIVAGTRGRNALAGLLLGSVAQRLVQTANRPTVAVPA